MTKLILATTSPHRQEALKSIGLDFVAEGSNIEEYSEDRPNDPEELVKYLSRLKAEAVAKNHTEGIVIGFDSIGWFNGRIIEKLKTKKEAFQILKELSEKTHQFYTGLYMINVSTCRRISRVVKTDVSFRRLCDFEINRYLNQDSDFKTFAVGFNPLKHYSSTFTKEIRRSYNNFLRGIPLEVVMEMLYELE